MAAPFDENRTLRRFVTDRSEEAFRQLYRLHAPFLFGLALRQCSGRRDAAEDALQEAWLRAAERIAAFRGQSTLRTWLAGFVVNCCREQRRREGLPPEASPRESFGRHIDTASAARIDLEKHLAALPSKQRDVLVLHDLQGFTHQEVGMLLAIPAGTSKRRLFDARRTLRQRLDGAPRQAPEERAGDRP